MLIASFKDVAAADIAASRFPSNLRRIAPCLLLWSDTSQWPQMPAPLFGLQGEVVDRRTSHRLSPQAVAAALATKGDAALADWAPPFRLVWQTAENLSAAADHCGLGHLFIWSGNDVVAVADSAVALAQKFNLPVDRAALGGLALTGAFVGLDTAIAGVTKLPPGTIAGLSTGTLTLRAMPAPSLLAAPRDALASSVARLHAAFPDAEMELSGGWDSRLMLAALDPAARTGITGFTIGNGGDPDVVVAKQLAAFAGMHHDIFDQSALARLSPTEFAETLASAAARDDYGANPLDRAGLNIVNATRPPRPRFSGQNGEILRGFYYPGQPLAAAPSAALASRIINWRIISNDLVSPSLFDPAWLAATRATITARLTDQLVGGDASWGDALDRFYLEQRMHRWCGTAVSAAIARRPILLPFFDADVLALARATPSTSKAGSRFVAREITRLDPGLAAIALDSGLVPARVAAGGPLNKVAPAMRFAAKTYAKLRQILSASDRATAGSATAGAIALRHRLHASVDIHRLAGLSIFNAATLDSFAAGTQTPGRATLGFIVNADRLLSALATGEQS